MPLCKCPNCGEDVSDKASKCVHCGFNLATEIACPECKTKYGILIKSCPKCGCPNDNVYKEKPVIITCPHCGFRYDEKLGACPECGKEKTETFKTSKKDTKKKKMPLVLRMILSIVVIFVLISGVAYGELTIRKRDSFVLNIFKKPACVNILREYIAFRMNKFKSSDDYRGALQFLEDLCDYGVTLDERMGIVFSQNYTKWISNSFYYYEDDLKIYDIHTYHDNLDLYFKYVYTDDKDSHYEYICFYGIQPSGESEIDTIESFDPIFSGNLIYVK